jgi:hypothetical protein
VTRPDDTAFADDEDYFERQEPPYAREWRDEDAYFGEGANDGTDRSQDDPPGND